MVEPGFTLYLIGRLRGVPRGRLALAVEAAGGRLTGRLSGRVDLVALSHSSAFTVLCDAPPLALPEAIAGHVRLISERSLKRSLGLLVGGAEHRDLASDDVQRASGLTAEIIRALALYDVLEPVDDLFSFRDLRAAKEARRLIEHGFGLDEIAEASMVLRRVGRGLFDTSVTEAPWGDLMQQVGSRLGRLNGQLELALEDDCETVDEIFSSAEDCECAGDLDGAERLYRIANRIDRADPVIPFNLGNVLEALGRSREAVLSYQEALARDATFVEAWINLAAIQESAGRVSDAEASLRKALDSSPASGAALHNLALLLTKAEQYNEALPLWDRYIALKPARPDLTHALRLRALCRLATGSNRHLAGRSQIVP